MLTMHVNSQLVCIRPILGGLQHACSAEEGQYPLSEMIMAVTGKRLTVEFHSIGENTLTKINY